MWLCSLLLVTGLSPGVYRLCGKAKGDFQKDLCLHIPPRTVVQGSCPYGRLLSTHASAGDPQTLTGRFGSVSCGVTVPFPWVLACTFCCDLQESLFPPVLWKFCNWILLSFKVRFPGDSQSLCWIPRIWGLEPSQKCENFFGIIVLQFVDCPPRGHGTWFYHDCIPPTILLQLLLCPWLWGIFFCVWVQVSSCWWLFSS